MTASIKSTFSFSTIDRKKNLSFDINVADSITKLGKYNILNKTLTERKD
jgi:hypothetical protein